MGKEQGNQRAIEFILDPTDPRSIEIARQMGCVVRTLASIAETEATDEEYLARFNYAALSTVTKATGDPELLKALFDNIKSVLNRLERESITDLIEKLQGEPTPLGQALSRYRIIPHFSTLPMYQRFIGRGDRIAIILPNHMFHLGFADAGPVSLSDNNSAINLPSNEYTPFHGYIFRPVESTS